MRFLIDIFTFPAARSKTNLVELVTFALHNHQQVHIHQRFDTKNQIKSLNSNNFVAPCELLKTLSPKHIAKHVATSILQQAPLRKAEHEVSIRFANPTTT